MALVSNGSFYISEVPVESFHPACRFYSFVPDPTTTVRPVDRYEQSYRPQPPPLQQQPLPSPPRRVSSVDSDRHESPDRKFDYYDEDEDYDYIDHYNINYGDQVCRAAVALINISFH